MSKECDELGYEVEAKCHHCARGFYLAPPIFALRVYCDHKCEDAEAYLDNERRRNVPAKV